MDFLEPRWEQDVPAPAEVLAALASLHVEPWPLRAPALDELLAELRAAHVNGGALFARFRLSSDPVLHWYGSRNRWDEMGFFERFLASDAVRATLPELQPAPGRPIQAKFTWGNSLMLDGELAQALVAGGAYVAFRGTPREAKTLAGRACDELFGDRFSEVMIYRTSSPWCPWFYDIAWDRTWVGIDKRTRAVWLLCITDTD